MKLRGFSCIAICLAMAGGSARAGTVDVAFVHPEAFTDVRDQDLDALSNLQAIAEYLQSLGQKNLPANQSLHIDVLNVDLAGKLHPSRRWGWVRVVGGQLDWPRMTLSYRLEENGTVLASGQDAIADMAYSSHLDSHAGWDSLESEKRMLRDWFRSRFTKP